MRPGGRHRLFHRTLGLSMLKSWWTAAGVAAMMAGVLVAFAPNPPATQGDDEAMILLGGHGDDRRDGGPMYFVLEGKPVRGLYPGAVRQMKITVFNPLGYRLRVQQLTGKVVRSSRRGCPATAASLQVRKYNGTLPVTIPARSRTHLTGTLPVAMPPGTTRQCAGARFTISVSGVGYRADR